MKAQDIGRNTTTVYALTGELHGKVPDIRPAAERPRTGEANPQASQSESQVEEP